MLIKFFPNGKGGGAGPVNYLTATTVLAYDENRDLIRDESRNPVQVTRDPLPVVLRGDPASMTDLIDICSHKWSYRAGVISFAEDDAPSEDAQQAMIDRFEELVFAGLDKDQYACLWVRHSHEDRIELHFCTPRMELDSGRSLNVAPPGYERAFDSLREVRWTQETKAELDGLKLCVIGLVRSQTSLVTALDGWMREDQTYEQLSSKLKDSLEQVRKAQKQIATP